MPVVTDRVWMSRAFERQLSQASPWLYEASWRKIAYFVDSKLRVPGELMKAHKVRHLASQGIDVYEIDAGSTQRILADCAGGRLALLRLGDKPIVPGYSKALRREDLSRLAEHALYRPPDVGSGDTPAPSSDLPLEPAEFFGRAEEVDARSYDAADSEEWLYFLSEQQGVAAELVIDAIERTKDTGRKRIFIVGPPGTGKTAILLNLLVRSGPLRIDAKVSLSPNVARYTELCGVRLEGRTWRPADRRRPRDLLLVDDPQDPGEIERAISGTGNSRVVVVAFDPLQLKPMHGRPSFTDGDFESLKRRFRAEEISLTECYRQRSVLGKAAKRTLDVIAESSPFFRADKTETFRSQRARLVGMANAVEFVYAGGREATRTAATPSEAHRFVRDAAGQTRWRHAPGLLVVVDENSAAMDWPWRKWMEGVRHCLVGARDTESIKGLDFQHAILVLGRSLFDQTRKPFQGVSQAVYEERKLLRIPFTRARESLTVLVTKDAAAADPAHAVTRNRELFRAHRYR
jgi:hypothetical protein